MNEVSGGQEVVLMLSDSFASQLVDLARQYQVWACRTPVIERVARDFWEAHPPLQNVDAEAGITLFTGAGNPEEDLLSIVDTIELHHGLASKGPKVNSLRILGAQLTDSVREAIATLGFTRVELITGGFMAHWHQQ